MPAIENATGRSAHDDAHSFILRSLSRRRAHARRGLRPFLLFLTRQGPRDTRWRGRRRRRDELVAILRYRQTAFESISAR